MKTMFSDYENNVVNVPNSILKYFNLDNPHSTLKILDEKLEGQKYKNVMLVLFDGLGYNLLREYRKLCPFLYNHLVGPITSAFPSTTMSSRTSIETGLYPVEHGWVGWDMYFKEFDQVITLSKNSVKTTGEVITDYNIGKTLLKYESVVNKIEKLDGCNAKKISVYHNHKGESLKNARMQIQEIVNNGSKNYIYLYYDEPDHLFHKFGNDSTLAKMKLRKIDKEFKKLCTSLKDTLVIALADHGHIKCEYVTLSDHPTIMNMLKGDTSIDSRTVAFRVKDEYKIVFPGELKRILKDDFIIMTSEEVRARKLFGDALENKYFSDALGDYVAIGITNKCIRYNEKKHKHKSSHSGITEEEMLVPLVIYEGESNN